MVTFGKKDYMGVVIGQDVPKLGYGRYAIISESAYVVLCSQDRGIKRSYMSLFGPGRVVNFPHNFPQAMYGPAPNFGILHVGY